jgi:dTDP-4-amino-4,6-dideoxygalactose transaminase
LALCGVPPIRKEFLPFGVPRIDEDAITEVAAALRSGWISAGPRVAEFERAFARYQRARCAIATSSCTAALHLALLASGVGPGDEVITTPLTFCATANAIVHAGAQPVFADVDRRTMNLDPRSVKKALSSRTRAIIAVHLAGRPCDMKALGRIARERGLILISDCAHAIETRYEGKPLASWSLISCYSFYATKNLTTGDGGMLVTNDEGIARRARMLAAHGLSLKETPHEAAGSPRHYRVVEAGFKYNMTDIEAALGLKQLGRIEAYHRRRAQIAVAYTKAFTDLPLILPAPVPPGVRHAWHLYQILIDSERLGCERDAFGRALFAEGIGCSIHFPALHLQPFYFGMLGKREGDFPNAEFISDRTLSLPLSARLTDVDVADVTQAVRKVALAFAE